MKRITNAVLVLLMLSLASMAMAQPMKLEYKFKKGSVDKYKLSMVMHMSMPDMPETGGSPSSMDMSMKGLVSQKVVDIYRDGSAKIKTTVSDMKVVMPGGKTSTEKAPAKTITIIMNKNGKVKSISTGDGSKTLSMGGMDINQMLGQAGPSFPDKAISDGDKWQQVVPFPMGGGKLNVSSTLVKSGVKIGKYPTSQIRQVMTGQIDLAELVKNVSASQKGSTTAVPEVKGTLDIVGSSNTFFSPSLGKLIKSEADATMTSDMDIPQSAQPGAPSHMRMVVEMKMTMTKI